MRTYATKQEKKVVCAGCGRVYAKVITGVASSEGASGCPRCALQQGSGQKKAGKESKKKSSKKE